MAKYEVNCRNVIVFNMNVLSFIGVIPPDFRNTNLIQKILYFFRVSIIGFLCGGLIFCQAAYLYLTLMGPIHEIVKAAYLTMTNMLSGVKLYWVYQTRRRITSLVATMSDAVFQPKNQCQAGILDSYIRLSKNVTIVLIIMSQMVICLMTIYPCTVGERSFLPLTAHIPFNTDYSPIFEITYAFEVVGIILGSWSGVNTDGLLIGFIIFVCAQLALLNDSIEHLRELCLDENEDVSRDDVLDQKMKATLIDCIDQHRHISAFKYEVSSIFGTLTLLQFMISILTLCTNLFELTTVSELNVQLFALISCMLFLLAQIYCMCYFGNEIILKSFQLTNSAYHSDWPNYSVDLKKNLIIFMIRSHIDMTYLAGNLFTLSLDTFVKIVKSAVSYFTVLHQLLGDDSEYETKYNL